jgi:hypothetical protein
LLRFARNDDPGIVAPASADDFPCRPITWIVPFTPGGITDTTSGLVAGSLGQSVLIDNRGDAGGTVGTEQAARAKPDGYTILYGTQGDAAAILLLLPGRSAQVLRADHSLHGVVFAIFCRGAAPRPGAPECGASRAYGN